MKAFVLPAALAAAVGLSACGGEESPTTAAATADSIDFQPNRKVYALPLDRIRALNDGSIAYAANLIVKQCMEDSGFPWPIPSYDPTVRPPATWNATGRRLFDVEIASRYGYHLAPATGTDDAADSALNARTLGASEQRQLARCRRAATGRVAPPDSRLVDSLAGAAYDSALAEGPTVAAARKWRSCLAPQGISDLPPAPNEMPSPSIAKRFRLGVPGTASAEEIELATADARCRESSGYAQQLYESEAQHQLELFSRNRDALERARAAALRNRARARAIVARYGT